MKIFTNVDKTMSPKDSTYFYELFTAFIIVLLIVAYYQSCRHRAIPPARAGEEEEEGVSIIVAEAPYTGIPLAVAVQPPANADDIYVADILID